MCIEEPNLGISFSAWWQYSVSLRFLVVVKYSNPATEWEVFVMALATVARSSAGFLAPIALKELIAYATCYHAS